MMTYRAVSKAGTNSGSDTGCDMVPAEFAINMVLTPMRLLNI